MQTLTADLALATQVVDSARDVVAQGVKTLAAGGGPYMHQVLAYDLAHSAAAVETAAAMLAYGELGDVEAKLTCAFVADMLFEVSTRLLGREAMWGVAANALSSTHEFMATYREPDFVGSLATTPGPRHLEGEFEMVQDTFRSYATKEIAPRAEHVHRHNSDVPEEIIAGLAELGAFGLSVPAEYGGFN